MTGTSMKHASHKQHPPTAAQVLLDTLVQRGADRAFCVPGESYIALLDAIHGEPGFDLVTCRHEGGAGFMAVADARLTGRPGIALVSRGPGACNASIAVHTAEQDAVPLILIIGQVEGRDLRRNAFQEIDYKAMFGGIAKWVGEIKHPDEAPELAARAWTMATSGVPGPVILSAPEDVLAASCNTPAPPLHSNTTCSVTAEQAARIATLIQASERPILLAGREFDVPGGREALLNFAETWGLPVAVSFRRQDIFPNDHDLYVGDLGLKNPDAQRIAFSEADLVLAIGTRLTDITTQGYSWPTAQQTLVHSCSDPRFLGWQFPAALSTTAGAISVIDAVNAHQPGPAARLADWAGRLRDLHVSDSTSDPKDYPDGVDFVRVANLIEKVVSADAIVTLDAGTFAAPFYRKVRWRQGQRLIAPISGAMGFGVPAAVAASLRHPDRTVICMVGDGGVMMSGNEMAVGFARNLPIKVIISENNSYGSIRIHQEKDHPGRVSGTDLANPDLASWAKSFGAPLLAVNDVADLQLLSEALLAPGPLIALVKTSLQAVLPKTAITMEPASLA